MTTAFVQARFSSTRLPGKVLLPLDGKPMLALLLERLGMAKSIDKTVVLSSSGKEDEAIVALCERLGVDVFCGSLEDVLDRYYQASKRYSDETFVRITGDCPLIDPDVIDELVGVFHQSGVDYCSNTIPPTFPDGLDVEVFSLAALESAWRESKLKSHREHVTLYLKDNPGKYSLKNVEYSSDQSSLRITVDEQEDYELIGEIIATSRLPSTEIRLPDIIDFFDAKESECANQHIVRDEGLLTSRCEDALNFEPRIGKSLAHQRRAKDCIPGETQLLSKRANQFSEGIWPGYFSRAKGSTIWDLDDNAYLDMSIGGIGATILGYADEDVDAQVVAAIQTGVASSLNCPQEIELAEFICGLHPWSDMARLTRTGGEAMTVAVRLARASTQREKVIICGYHGWHDWYLAANLAEGDHLNGHLLPGLKPMGVPKSLAGSALTFPYNDLDALKTHLLDNSGQIAAIVMEPMRSDLPKPGFLEEIRRLADANDIVLIFDEVSSGFRFSNGGVHLQLGVDPDIAVFSKSIANGYAMAAVIGRAAVMRKAEDTFISSTCWTEKVGPVAALACMRKFIEKDVSAHLNNCGQIVKSAWLDSAKRFNLPIVVSGQNPICSFTFNADNFPALKALFVQIMMSQGILASNSYYAMFSHSTDQLARYRAAVEVAFKVIAEAIEAGDVEDKLKGAPSVPGFGRLVR